MSTNKLEPKITQKDEVTGPEKPSLFNNKRLRVILSLLVILGLAGYGYKLKLDVKNYQGAKPVLVTATRSDTSAIEMTVIGQRTEVPAGTNVDIVIQQFIGNGARGTFKYGGNYGSGKFIAHKLNQSGSSNTNGGWKIIAYGDNDNFVLPSKVIAQRYSLPAGWYRER
jgi:hypothetical protein